MRERGPGEQPAIVDLKRAPPEIAIGDLKGGMDSVEAAEAPEQLENYLEGFRIVASELNEYGRKHPELVEPDARGRREWHPTRRKLRKGEVKVPQYYKPGKATGQASERLVLVDKSGWADMDFSRRNLVRGKLYVFPIPVARACGPTCGRPIRRSRSTTCPRTSGRWGPRSPTGCGCRC